MKMKYKRYSSELKEAVVKEYLAGATPKDIWQKYEIKKDRVFSWTEKWREHGCFPDGRGKGTHRRKGRTKIPRVDESKMTKDELIEYLRMQLEIKKYLAFYEKRKLK
jgi:transposase-like protein